MCGLGIGRDGTTNQVYVKLKPNVKLNLMGLPALLTGIQSKNNRTHILIKSLIS